MNSEAIRRALFRVRKEKSQAQIARDLNVTPTHINRVVKRLSESKRVKLAIAEALNKNPETVWPETFKKAS